MKDVLVGFFRCPESSIEMELTGKLSEQTGFFRLGNDTICYGQTCLGPVVSHPKDAVHDVLQDVRSDGPVLQLPFDPEQVINNLRLERYAQELVKQNHDVYSNRLAKSLYYLVRPLLSVAVRRHIQRLVLRHWQEKHFPKWPVDRTVETLMEKLLVLSMKAKGIDEIPFIWFWPDGIDTCTIITHDVETAEGRDHCDTLMDINDSFGVKSSFQVVPEDRYLVPKEYLENIRRRGFEVNVQDLNHDGHLYRDRKEFLRRVQRINQYINEYMAHGFRAGVLYRNVEWYESFKVSYDMSIPNVGHLDPQVGGCCTVFPFFIGSILELPVTMTQDYSLFHIIGDYSIDLWKKQIALISEKHGFISMIIHPDYLMTAKAERTYRDLLKYLTELSRAGKTMICLPKDVNAWWRARRDMKLVNENGKWRIEGEGKERARIAYARRDGDQISYSVEGRTANA